LRVAVLVESLAVPEWVEWTVAQIDTRDAFELTAVVPAGSVWVLPPVAGSERSARHLTYRLYQWVDTRVFGSPAAMRHTDLSRISSGRTMSAGVGPLDVVVSFLPADRTSWNGPAPRYGVWAIAPMYDGRPASAPSRFWELNGQDDRATTTVVVLMTVARVIAQGPWMRIHCVGANAKPRRRGRQAQCAAQPLRRDGIPRGMNVGAGDTPPGVTIGHGAHGG
jgi:hypothetical protein